MRTRRVLGGYRGELGVKVLEEVGVGSTSNLREQLGHHVEAPLDAVLKIVFEVLALSVSRLDDASS